MMVKSDLGKKGGTPFFASIPNNCVAGAAVGGGAEKGKS